MDNNTRKLLGITDPNIKFSDNWLLSNNKKQITRWSIMGTLTYKPKACPNCGAVNIRLLNTAFVRFVILLDYSAVNH